METKKSKMKKIQIYMPIETIDALKEEAKSNGTSYAMIIRDAVVKYGERKEKKRFSWTEHAKKVSKPAGGDISKNIDEILYGKNWNR